MPAVTSDALLVIMPKGLAAVMGRSKLESMAALLPLRSRAAETAELAATVMPMKEGKTALLPSLLAFEFGPLLAWGGSTSLRPVRSVRLLYKIRQPVVSPQNAMGEHFELAKSAKAGTSIQVILLESLCTRERLYSTSSGKI